MALAMQIKSIAPIGLNGDSRNALWHIIIATLGEDSSTLSIQILVLVGTAGIVASRLPIRVKSITCTSVIIIHRQDFPARHYLIGVVVAILFGMSSAIPIAKLFIIIRKLHLAVAIIMVQSVHVRNGEINRQVSCILII